MGFNWKKGRTTAAVILGAALALPTAALAQRYESLRDANRNLTVTGQAGVTTYTGDAAALTTPGAAYGVNAGIDLTRVIGLEVGYVGSVYQTQEGAESNQFRIFENGAQGLISASPGDWLLAPYAFTGVKVNRLSVSEDEAASSLANDSTQFKVPIGVGLNVPIPMGGPDWSLGARATYDATVSSEAFEGVDDSGHNQVTGTLSFGGRF